MFIDNWMSFYFLVKLKGVLKMKVSKSIVLVGTSLLCTVLLAACGGNGSSSNNSEILLWSSTTGPDGEKIKKND